MKNLIRYHVIPKTFLLFILIWTVSVQAQVPAELSQRNYGGNDLEYENTILPLDNGQLLVACESGTGINGDKTEDYGGYDIWIYKLDTDLNIIWDHTYGGDFSDLDMLVRKAPDGGYYVACSSLSDVSGNKTVPSFGSYDVWVFKIDSIGNIQWQTALGGDKSDLFKSMIVTSDGDLLIASYTFSGISGNKTVDSVGGYDIWLVKLDSMGNQIWQSRAGSDGWDIIQYNSLVERPNGNYLIAGWSEGSISGDKTIASFGGDDYWLVEFDTAGNIVWQGVYGWTSTDVASGVVNTSDGGFIVSGDSQSGIGGVKTSPSLGQQDFWILRFDADHNLLWDKTYGGAAEDYLPSSTLVWPDGSLVIAGVSLSGVSGNKTQPNYGASDFWILRLDMDGNEIWQKSYGGPASDYYPVLATNSDNELYIVGPSSSTAGGNKSVGTYGSYDTWLIHLEASDVCTDITVTIDTTVINANVTLADGSIADSSGTYYLTYDTPECDTSYIYNIQIIRTPVVNFTYSADLLDVSFTDLSENEPDSWLWYFGDGTTSAEQDPVHTYATAGTHAVCLQAGNAAGSAFSCALIEISDATAPVADFSWETIGDTTYFTDLSAPAPTSWIWLFGDGTAGSGQYPTHNYAVSGTYPVCMKAINAGGNDIICQLVDVCVPVQLSIAGTDSLCPGALIFINSTLAEASSFQWFKDGLPYAGAGATASTLMAIDAGSYTMSYTDAAGCTDTTDVINLYDAELPVVTLELENDQLCNQDGLITLSGGMPAGGTYFGPGVTDGVHVNTAMLLPGEYIISYAYGDICTAEATDTIWVNLNPSASATVGSASNNLCVNTPVVLLANSGAGYTYQWYRNNTLLPGETSLAYLASTPGNYQVEVTSAEGCSRLSAKRKVVSSGCREASDADAQFLVFPNPSSGNVQVYYASEKELIGPVLLTILDTQGRMVWQSQPVAQNKMVSETVNTDLPTGMYVIRLQTGTGEQYSESLMITQE